MHVSLWFKSNTLLAEVVTTIVGVLHAYGYPFMPRSRTVAAFVEELITGRAEHVHALFTISADNSSWLVAKVALWYRFHLSSRYLPLIWRARLPKSVHACAVQRCNNFVTAKFLVFTLLHSSTRSRLLLYNRRECKCFSLTLTFFMVDKLNIIVTIR